MKNASSLMPSDKALYIYLGIRRLVVYRLSVRHTVSQPISTAYLLYDPTGDMKR
jgi:hypothetical protein